MWNFAWRMDHFVWEVGFVDDLLGVLNAYQISNIQDSLIWIYDTTGKFTVKSVYSLLMRTLGVDVSTLNYCGVRSSLGKSVKDLGAL
ncbi:hypothetical protein L195_g036299 [Trifolium pratense]|uniref:Uncharacterized protein n=1 Tax=Trifolium pratense TaxID=57577 RepID=A0A2K3LP43_TRIPR|nr:hypothetical protein L195_g036299 [Trifolium pratense]